MKRIRGAGLFITGTDTDVGKTFVAAAIAAKAYGQGHRVGVYKPCATGCVLRAGRLHADDAQQLWEAAGQPETLEHVCPQKFAAPLAPHLAARAAGQHVDETLLRQGLDVWRGYDLVVVEGVGGLMSPVSDALYVADLAEEFGWPLVVVAPNRIGVINQTLQTLIAAATFRDGLPVAGVVLNDRDAVTDASGPENAEELRRRCVSSLLAHVRHRDAGELDRVDWLALATTS